MATVALEVGNVRSLSVAPKTLAEALNARVCPVPASLLNMKTVMVAFGGLWLGLAACDSRHVHVAEPDREFVDPTAPNPSFVRSFGGNSRTAPTAIATDSEGNIYVGGYYFGAMVGANLAGMDIERYGDRDLFVAKLSIDGELVWLRTAGSSGPDQVERVGVDRAGNVYLTGVFYRGELELGATRLQGRRSAFFLASLDQLGEWRWAREIPGALDMAVASTGHVLLAGRATHADELDGSFVAAETTILAKVGADGSACWVVDLTGALIPEPPDPSLQAGESLLVGVDDDDASHVAGLAVFAGRMSIVATVDRDGKLLDTRQFGPGRTVAIDQERNAYTIDWRHGDDTILMAKRDPQSGTMWERHFSKPPIQHVRPLPGLSGETYVFGQYSGTAMIGKDGLASSGAEDVFVAKLDASGEFEWATTGGGSESDVIKDAAVDPSGRLIAVGTHYGGRFDGTDLPRTEHIGGFVWALVP